MDMYITKLGHCCLVLKGEGATILTDPGFYTAEEVKSVQGIDIVLITHEHGDHYHAESVQAVLANNPNAVVVSNGAVAKLLAEKGIACTVVGDGQSATVGGTLIEGFGKDHAVIYEHYGQCENTGYLVGGKFYFPGDAFHAPDGRVVEVLALPTAGPWAKLSEAIDFAKAVKPRVAFPVHDGMMMPGSSGFVVTILQHFLAETGSEFVPLAAGESKDF